MWRRIEIGRGMNVLKRVYNTGTDSYLSNLFFKTESQVSYTNKVHIGWQDYPKKEEEYSISFKDSKKLLILGGSGSGKTFTSRAIVSRAHSAGIDPLILTDIKPEFFTCSRPVQQKFRHLLFPKETPIGIPIKFYYPYCLYKQTGFKNSQQEIFQFKMNSINPYDMLTFINYEKLSESVKAELEDIVRLMEHYKFQNADELVLFIEKREMSTMVKTFLVKAIKNLKGMGVFGEKYEPLNLQNDINNHVMPVMNLFGWQRTDFKKYISLYLAIIIRDLLTSVQMKKIKHKHLLIVEDEAHSFVPRDSKSIATSLVRSETLNALRMGRSEKISFIFVSQSPLSIAEEVLDLVDYIFVPKTFPLNQFKELVKNYISSMYDFPYDFGPRMASQISSLRQFKDGAREWMVLEKQAGEMEKVTIAAPLCHHRLEGEM